MANSDIDADMKRTELFQNSIEQNRDLILNSLANTPDVTRLLKQRGVFTNEELERLQCMSSVWTMKQKLTDLILQRDFPAMKAFIKVLRDTGNEDLELLFEFHREQILEEYPPDTPDEDDDDGIESDCPGTPKITQFKIDDPDETREMIPDPVVIDIPYRRCSNCSYMKYFTAASFGQIHILRKMLASCEKIHPCSDCRGRTRGQTLIHAAVLSAENSKDVIERIKLLYEKLCSDLPDTEVENILNHRDAWGQTAIHLAAANERSKVVETLYNDYHCDILIKNIFGKTALDLINTHLPQITWSILNKETLAPDKNRDFQDGNELVIDFGRIIGCSLSPHRGCTREGKNEIAFNNAAQHYAETPTLRKYIESGSDQEDYNLLYHVMVKLFVDLKWKKMRPFLFTNMCLKVTLYLWYTLFIVNVFLAKCLISAHVLPARDLHSEESQTNVESASDKTLWTYLFGGWESAVQAMTGFYDEQPSSDAEREIMCSFEHEWQWQAVFFLVMGIILTLKELGEAVILSNIQHNRQHFLSAYWGSWENRFQIIFNILMILIGTLAFQTYIPNYYYSYAAISIVVVWALIFIQVGYLLGQGVYVQLLGKIIQRFGTLMLNYLCWIVAFSIALSILMPQAKPFETLPKAFLKVMTMMSGELEYENAFYGESDDQTGNKNGTESSDGPLPSIVFTAQIIYTSVVLLLTIILSNALIGLAVDDVRELQARSEVLLRSIKVDKMYTMESTLLKLQTYLFPSLYNLFNNIFLIQPKDIWKVDGDGMPTGNGMVLKVFIKDIPQQLQKEIREFALYPEAYEYKNAS